MKHLCEAQFMSYQTLSTGALIGSGSLYKQAGPAWEVAKGVGSAVIPGAGFIDAGSEGVDALNEFGNGKVWEGTKSLALAGVDSALAVSSLLPGLGTGISLAGKLALKGGKALMGAGKATAATKGITAVGKGLGYAGKLPGAGTVEQLGVGLGAHMALDSDGVAGDSAFANNTHSAGQSAFRNDDVAGTGQSTFNNNIHGAGESGFRNDANNQAGTGDSGFYSSAAAAGAGESRIPTIGKTFGGTQ